MHHHSHNETVKGVKIVLNQQTLGTILGVPSEGLYIFTYNVWPIDPTSPRILYDILGRRIHYVNFALIFGLLNLEMSFL